MNYDAVLAQFVADARAAFPAEACGLIYLVRGKPRLHHCVNMASNPASEFEISPEQFAEADALGDVIGVVHSHPGTTGQPSGFDVQSHAASGLSWWIVGLMAADVDPDIHFMPPASELPLVGRPFVHGVTDCYSVVRDYYRMERGVSLPDYRRDDNWWHKGGNLYEENFGNAGFVAVQGSDAPLPGDIILMNIGANVSNHAAVYLGDNVILHHLHGRLSCREVYTGFYRDRTRRILRFQDDQADR